MSGWSDGPLLVAHRGDRHEAPENTFAAFERALANGADAIELDIQVTRDGVPVVIHDERLDRTTNGSGEVRAHSWDELRALDAGAWYGPTFAGEHVPALADVLAWAETRQTRLLIEPKTHPLLDRKTAGALTAVLSGRPRESVILYSSDHALIADLARAIPDVRRGIIVNEHTHLIGESVRLAEASLLSQTVWCLTPATVDQAHALGCLVSAEVRHPEDVRRLLAWKVDLLVTERASVREVRRILSVHQKKEPMVPRTLGVAPHLRMGAREA